MNDPLLNNEKELLALIAQGDEKAFNRVFELHRDRMYYFLLKVTKSPEIAEDILIDVFMKLWVGRELLVNIRDLTPFLHKVAYNKALDFFKTTARHERLQQLYIRRMELTPGKAADELLIEEECRDMLLKAINQLPPQRRQIYLLSREEGLTHEQIAEKLHLSRHTVKNTIVSATRSVSTYLQKNYPGKTAITCLFFLA